MAESGKLNQKGCAGCRVPCSLSSESPDGSSLRGSRLTLSSAIFFLAPVVLGIAGAVCLGGSQGSQLVGATIGVVAGMTGSAILARVLYRDHRKRA